MIIRALLIAVTLSLTAQTAWAGEKVAFIEQFTGTVKVYKGDRKEAQIVRKTGYALYRGDRIDTGAEATALIAYPDGSRVMLKPKTVLQIEKEKLISIAGGRALFRMLKHAIGKFRVKIGNAVIGIKGTTFLVDAAGGKSAVYLKEGALNILAEKGEFVRFAASEEEAFHKYRDEILQEFDEFKREMEKEFARFVREFELEAGMGVSIEGNAALDVAIPDEIMEEFQAFDNFLEEENRDSTVKEDKQLTRHVSRTLTGEGYGKTDKEAKKEALADLSSAIQAEVQSEFKSIVTVFGKGGEDVDKVSRKIINVKSELPILGAEFTVIPVKKESFASAVIDSRKVLKLYMEKLKDIRRESVSLLEVLEKAESNSSQHASLVDLLTAINRYDKYKTVAILLGSGKIEPLPIAEAEVRERLRRIEKSVDSIDLATKIIAKGIEQKGIYIYPPKTGESNEITQFASIVSDKLAGYLKTVRLPDTADYFMTGNYEITDKGIDLTYHLSDMDFHTIKSRSVRLDSRSYAEYEVRPKTISFDKLLHKGYVVSSDFRIDVSTNSGRESLLFKDGDEIELFIKINSPGYFYLVGHVNKEKDRYSYLLGLQEGEGGRKFVSYVNADDANRWISLGTFEAVAPFGVESLQIIASSADLVDKLPSYEYDRNDGLYIISKNPESAVMQMRALKKKISKKEKTAEAVLMFTTMKKHK